MTPHHLHALAAAWSLHTARQRLAALAEEEVAQIAAEALEAPAVLRSPVWGGRRPLGGHGDPTAGMLAVADRPQRRNRWAEMADRAERRITGIAAMLRIHGVRDPLVCILAALPKTMPGTAAVLAKHLQDEDAWIRNAVGLPPARHPLVGVPCPNCGHRELYVQDAGPTDAWTVVCATGCRCRGVGLDGQGCPCGMPGAVEGVAHIWPRDVVLGAVAGAAS